jgi:hypothetical protein
MPEIRYVTIAAAQISTFFEQSIDQSNWSNMDIEIEFALIVTSGRV